MPFHAAKDLVYTINGNSISSGGYRISNILNGKSKKKGKQKLVLDLAFGSLGKEFLFFICFAFLSNLPPFLTAHLWL